MRSGTILITGVRGFLGSALERSLRASGAPIEVTGLDRAGGAGALAVDLLDPAATRECLARLHPDCIFHMAGVVYHADWPALLAGNVTATVNLLEAVKVLGLPCRVVIPGSAAEYGIVAPSSLPVRETHEIRPVSPYGASKAMQVLLAGYYSSAGLDIVTGRVFNVIGRNAPDGISVGTFFRQLRRMKEEGLPGRILVGNLAPRRDFLDIEDACRGLLAIAERGESGAVYHICSGASVSMESILRQMIRRSGMDVEVVVDSSRLRGVEVDDIYGSYERLHGLTGWAPAVTLEQSIEKMFEGC